MPSKQRQESGAPEGYWELVRAAMVKLYGGDSRRASKLRREVRAMDARKRSFFYHMDPLSVAANLSGKVISESDVEKYHFLPEWLKYSGQEETNEARIIVTDSGTGSQGKGKSITKAELVRKVVSQTHISAEQTGKVLDATLKEIRNLAGNGILLRLTQPGDLLVRRRSKRKIRSGLHVPLQPAERA